MKRVLLLGATGMLGSAVYDVLKNKYDLLLGVRLADKLALLEKAYGQTGRHTFLPFDAAQIYEDYKKKNGISGAYLQEFLRRVGEIDHVVNAVGLTIPFALGNPALTFFINGALPHILARIFGEKLIQITTDCVYSGTEGFPYDERSLASPVDIYGLSKSLGEPTRSLTIRTSVIGRELAGFTGLLEWFRQQEGRTITGFAEHYWNGITACQFGKVCDQIMESPDRFPRSGIFHIFSTAVSKYDMLLAFQRKYKIRCTIRADYEKRLNRTLATAKELNEALRIPSFPDMLEALPD